MSLPYLGALPLYRRLRSITHFLCHPAWSAPSAIGTAGLGIGTQAGAELTDFLVVLNSKSAVVSRADARRSLNISYH